MQFCPLQREDSPSLGPLCLCLHHYSSSCYHICIPASKEGVKNKESLSRFFLRADLEDCHICWPEFSHVAMPSCKPGWEVECNWAAVCPDETCTPSLIKGRWGEWKLVDSLQSLPHIVLLLFLKQKYMCYFSPNEVIFFFIYAKKPKLSPATLPRPGP